MNLIEKSEQGNFALKLKEPKFLYLCEDNQSRHAGTCIPSDGGGEQIWTTYRDYDGF